MRLSVAVFLFLLIATFASAEVVYFLDGASLEGKVREDKNNVYIDGVQFPKSKVANIEKVRHIDQSLEKRKVEDKIAYQERMRKNAEVMGSMKINPQTLAIDPAVQIKQPELEPRHKKADKNKKFKLDTISNDDLGVDKMRGVKGRKKVY